MIEEPALSEDYADLLRDNWWGAVATLTRCSGISRPPRTRCRTPASSRSRPGRSPGCPASPGAWLTGTARHKALDRLRREGRRPAKEAEAGRMAEATGRLSRV